MATGSIKMGLPVSIEEYIIAGNTTTNITLGASFRGFAVTSAYASDDIEGFYIIAVNAAGNTTKVKTAVAATKISIPASDGSAILKVTNSSSNNAILMLFRNLMTY